MMTKKYTTLAVHLREDIVQGIKNAKASEDPNPKQKLCPELFHEALELMLNIVTIKEVHQICDKAKINGSFLQEVLTFCQNN